MPPASNPSPFRQPDAIAVGPDKVWFLSNGLAIYAARAMPDWEVRYVGRAAIFFQDKKYFLAEEVRLPNRQFRYELRPWPDDVHDTPSAIITYDEEYIRFRDQVRREGQGITRRRFGVLALYPILGFLPSAIKKWLEEELGISARRATSLSLFLQFTATFLYSMLWSWSGGLATLVFGLLAGFQVGNWTIAESGLHLAVICLLLLDCVMRYDHLLREVPIPDGFLEWLVKLFWWKRTKASTQAE